MERTKNNQHLEAIAQDKSLKALCRRITRERCLGDDLWQEVLLRISTVDFSSIKAPIHYVVRIIFNEWNNPRSEFNQLYFDQRCVNVSGFVEFQDHDETYDFDQDEREQKQIDASIEALNAQYWYNEQLTKMYVETGMSYRQLSRKTRIPYRSIAHAVKETLTDVKEQVTQCR